MGNPQDLPKSGRARPLAIGGVAALALVGWGAATVGIVADAKAQASKGQTSTAGAALVFDNVTVVDVEQGRLVPEQRVVIEGNRIQAMGPTGQVRSPSGARVVDAKGKYLMPGLWDLHTHPRRKAESFYPLFVANGVTGFRDGWSEVPLDTVIGRWKEILEGNRVGPPRQLISGPPHPTSYETMADRKTHGANFFKVYPFSFPKAEAARRAGVPFGGHIHGAITAADASDSGMVIIDHVNTSGGLNRVCWGNAANMEECQPLTERLLKNGTWFVPTLMRLADAGMGEAAGGRGERSRPILQRFRDRVKEYWGGTLPVGNWLRDTASPGTVLLPSADSVGTMRVPDRVGLPILAGTDAGAPVLRTLPPGFAIHAELAMYVAEGLSPAHALQTATLNPAKMLRGTDSLGTIAAGKLADLILLDGDPLADITNTTAIRAVVANGRYYDRAALDSLLTEVQGKGP